MGVIEDVADNDHCVDGTCADFGSKEEDTCPSPGIKLGDASLVDVGVRGSRGLLKRPADDKPGDFLDGSVLLLWTPLPVVLLA